MTFQQLNSFVAVVEYGSFSKAEETTFLTKQALKKQIDAMESELEFKLMKRNTKGIQLTPAGEMFFTSVKKGLKTYEDIINHCRSIAANQNQIRIGNPPHPRLLLENIFNEFSALYPDIHQEIVLSKNDLPQKILEGKLDIAEFVFRPEDMVDGVSFQRIMTMEYRCVVANNHPLALKGIIEPEELVPYPVGIVPKANSELINYLHGQYPNMVINKFETSDIQNILTLCYNHGVFVSKAYFVHLLPPLKSIPLHSDITYDCGVIYRDNPSEPVKLFLDLINKKQLN